MVHRILTRNSALIARVHWFSSERKHSFHLTAVDKCIVIRLVLLNSYVPRKKKKTLDVLTLVMSFNLHKNLERGRSRVEIELCFTKEQFEGHQGHF